MRKISFKNVLIVLTMIGVMLLTIFGDMYINGKFIKLSFKENTIEYGEKVDLNKILKNKDIKIVKVENLNSKKVGTQKVKLTCKRSKNNKEYGVSFKKEEVFKVIDTKKPIIKLVNKEFNIEKGKILNWKAILKV